jgi:hypothetical protein
VTAQAAIPPKSPDFQTMTDLETRINDATFTGLVKRTLHMTAAIPEMLNALLDGIESAKAFINAEEQKCVTYSAQVKAYADQEYNPRKEEAYLEYTREKEEAEQEQQHRKAEAVPEYEREKAEAERKKKVEIEQNEQQREASLASLQAKFEETLNSPDLPGFEKDLLSARMALGASEDGWDTYAPSDGYPKEIMLGTTTTEVFSKLPANVLDMVKQKMPGAYSTGNSITVPVTASIEKAPLNIRLEYDSEQKTSVMAGIQSIILKLIRFMPPFSFSLTYIDPNDRGSNLGLLLKLSSISAFDMCKKAYASKEDIAKRLKELELFVDQTIAGIVGTDSIYAYNASHKAKIPYHLVVINDYDLNNFERPALESLRVLRNNSKKCGISFIFTSTASLNGQTTSDVFVQSKNNGVKISIDGQPYNFAFDGVIPACDAFLEAVKTVYNDGIR